MFEITVYCNDALYPDCRWREISHRCCADINELFEIYGFIFGNNPVKLYMISDLKYGETKTVYCGGVRYDIYKVERWDL